MAEEIRMPQLSDTMNDGKIVEWRVSEGDTVRRGDILAEVETDKANLEIEAFYSGVLLKIITAAGNVARVGDVIAVIGEPNEQPKSSLGSSLGSSSSDQAQSTQFLTAVNKPNSGSPDHNGKDSPLNGYTNSDTVKNSSEELTERVKVSPLARRLAEEQNIDLTKVVGTGPQGRIVKRDLKSPTQPFDGDKVGTTVRESSSSSRLEEGLNISEAGMLAASLRSSNAATISDVSRGNRVIENPTSEVKQVVAQSTVPFDSGISDSGMKKAQGGRFVELSKMRATIARRMQESVQQSPHFYLTTTVRMDEAEKLRILLKEQERFKGLSVNHLVIKATASSLKEVPDVNSSMKEDKLFVPDQINIGIITAIEGGLLIPVLHNVNELPLADIVYESRALVDRARSGRPSGADLSGGTFSISNMGMVDVESFTAIINPGQGGILAVSSIKEEPVVDNGTIKIGKLLRLTLSVDHRIIDGVTAGTFMKTLKRYLENPALLLIS
jgi:pyruvate dehydrogenase E2 component (dihydrolipoamide acetyltransferase)